MPARLQSKNSSIQTLFIGVKGNVLLILLGLFLMLGGQVFGQNGVTISSDEPDPTSANPIPININFEGPINRNLVEADFSITNGEIGNFERGIPEFVKGAKDRELSNFLVNGGLFAVGSNPESYIEDAVISITQLNQSELLFLTYGNGVKRLNLISGNIDNTLIDGSNLDSPLDIEASLPNPGQQLYITDKTGKRTYYYDNATNLIDHIGLQNPNSSSDIGPTSVVTDSSGNIFIAVAFTGDADVNIDRVEVYNASGNFIQKIPKAGSSIVMEGPYRIAVDNQGRVYVADGGGSTDNGRILIFNENYDHIHTIEGPTDNLGAPGSVVVDDFGYVYVIDYQDDLKFNGIFQNPLELLLQYPTVRDKSYAINVYDSNSNFEYVTEFNQGLNLPIDLEIDYCGNILVNNLELTGPEPNFRTGVNINFNFQLKTFTRHDHFSAEVTPEDEGEVVVTLNPENDFFPCDPQPEGDFSITYQPQVPPISCKPATLYLDASGIAVLNPADIFDGDATASNIDELEVNRTTFTCSEVGVTQPVVLTVRYTDGTSDDCMAQVTVLDEIDPVAVCIAPGKEFTLVNGSVTIDPADIDNGSDDNCSFTLSVAPSTFTTPGTKTVTLRVTDPSGLIDDCPTTIEVVDPTQPPISCKPATLYLDSDGSAVLEPADIFDGDATASNIEKLEASKTVFGCSDVGGPQSVVLTVLYTDGTLDNCTAQVTVIDDIDPVAVCIAQGKEFTLVNGSVTIDPEDIDDGSTDNCSFTLSVTPSTFTTTGTKTVTLTVKDAAGNEDTCPTTIEIVNPSQPPIACKPATVYLDAGGTAVLDSADIFDGDASASNIEKLEASKIVFGCSDIGSAQTVTLTVRYTDGTSDDCTAQVTVLDENNPVAVCIAPGKEFTLVNGSVTIDPEDIDDGSTDNCSLSLSVTPSTFTTTGTKSVSLIVTDNAGNVDTCPTTIEIVNPTQPPIACKPATVYLDAGGTAVLDSADIFDGDASASNIEKLEASETVFGCSEIGSSQTITLTVRYTDGTSDDCTAQITVLDENNPVAVCIAPGKEFTLVNGSVTIDPEDIDDGSDDNCSFTLSVTPSTFTTTGTKTVSLTVKDAAGNEDTCPTTIEIVNPTQPPIACKPATVYLDEGGTAVLDPADIFDGDASASNIEKLEASKTVFGCSDVGGPQSVVLTVFYTDGTSNNCSAQATVLDELAPVVNCPPDQVENFDPAIGFAVPDYTGMASASDNCGVLEVVQTPTEGTTIFGTKEIKLTATDQAGNIAECSFTLSLTEEEVLEITCIPDQTETLDGNCQFVIPNYTDQASVNYPNAIITQSPEPGLIVTSDTSIILAASLNGETDICEFKILLEEDIEAPVANCIATGIFELGPNGTLTLPAEQIENNSTDNCGIAGFTIDKTEFTTADIGENVITLTVTDTAGNMDTCQTTITIVPNENTGSDFNCVSQIILELDSSGNATLNATDLYTGDPGNRVFTLSKDNFNCSNLGSNEVTLSYTGSDGSGSCDINVEVVDSINPVLITNNINVSLNAQGQATISPQLINNGSYDNCGELTFSLNKNTFSCKDIGENVISLRGEDGSGNISTVTATVTVTGNCNGIPDNPVDYIYIYPNPTTGPFTFAVPQGWIIEKAEVFDSRGRYLITQSFEERSSYSMDLTGFQDAVYVLLLYTNKGKKIVRVIIH